MNNKIYYLHVPKTAGTVLNNFLQQGINKDRTIEHIEIKTNILHKEKDIYNRYDFISGHIPIENISSLIKNPLESYDSIVTLRNPLSHLLSHLTFVKEIGINTERFFQHSKNIQKIVTKLNKIDFSNLSHLKDLIIWLEDNKLYLFHNNQTVYLSIQPSGYAVGLEELRRAMNNIEKINFVGIQERLDEFMLMLAYHLKKEPSAIIEKKLNTTKSRYGLDINNKEVQKILYPLYGLDIVLYEKAKKIFFNQYYDFVKSIEIEENKIFLTKYENYNFTRNL